LRRERWLFAVVELFRRFAIFDTSRFQDDVAKAIGSAMATYHKRRSVKMTFS